MEKETKKICSYNHQKVERFERCPECNEKMTDNHWSDADLENSRKFNENQDWKNSTGKYSDFSGGWFKGAFE